MVEAEHADVDPVIVAERLSKAWEPYLPEAIEQIPTAELRSLLDEFGAAIASARVGAMEYTMEVIEGAMRRQDGPLKLFVGIKDLVQFHLAADRGNHLVADSYRTRHPAVLDGVRRVVETARSAGTPVRAFSPASDLAHYLEHLPPPDGCMMCTAELQQMITQSYSLPEYHPLHRARDTAQLRS